MKQSNKLGDLMKIYETKSKDKVYKHLKGVAIVFSGKRNVLSTSIFNGGYREDINYVFNKDENLGAGIASKLRAPTYEEHLALIATELGLDPEVTTGISTAASMENLAIVSEMYHDVQVTAFVTGGVEVNGGRAGDPASYDELTYKKDVKAGTINILLHVDANLPPGIMTRALVTCTEAKSVALSELMADSRYSSGLATGSGTDGTIIISNLESPTRLTNAGKHSVFGEIIGRVVKTAVKEALYKQSDLGPNLQHSILRRGRRFGITENQLWARYEGPMKMYDFLDRLHRIEKEGNLVALSTAYFHLMDEMNYELIKEEDAYFSAEVILKGMLSKYDLDMTLATYKGIEGLSHLYSDAVLEIVKCL